LNGTNQQINPVVKAARKDEIYKFGFDGNQSVGKLVLKDLLLLSIDKDLRFNAPVKGKCTFQNFNCYTGIGASQVRSSQDEARVRNALSVMYNEIDSETKSCLASKRPMLEEGGIPAWNQKRNQVASSIQEKVMEKLRIEEGIIAAEQSVEIPKQCKPLISAVMNRLDKISQIKASKAAVKMTDSLSSFLHSTPKNM
jgi:hypothetical protein